MFVALYVRVSTGNQIKGTSLESQYDNCLKKALEMGFKKEQIKLYREEGASGEDLERPQLDELRNDIAMGIISHVIITDPDRFSRNLTNKLIVCQELNRRDVELIFTDEEYKDTPEGELFFNMKSTIAQYELQMIKKRTVRGRLKTVEKLGKIMPMRVAPYGYDLKNSQLFINEEEAKFVKMIYEWYVHKKYTMREIGESLRKLGAIPKRGESNYWNASSIMRILTSEIYIGNYYYNRRETKKKVGEKTASGRTKKKYEKRDPSQWIHVKVPNIIETGLFELAQQQRSKNTRKPRNMKYEYLLKSLVRCGHCGRFYECTTYKGRPNKDTGEKKLYTAYRCPNINPRKYDGDTFKCKHSQSIRTELIDDYVWNLIVDALIKPDQIFLMMNEEENQSINEVKQLLKMFEKQIEQLMKQREKLKNLYLKDMISEDEMERDIAENNKQIAKLKNEIQVLESQISTHNKHESTFDAIQKMVNFYKELILNTDEKNLTYKQKRMVTESLINEIVITFNEGRVNMTFLGMFEKLRVNKLIDIGLKSQPQEIREHR